MFCSGGIVLIIFLLLPGVMHAAEVLNLKTHFSGTRLTIDYDLSGTTSEKESAIDVLLEINGRKYSPNMLSMSGDFGHSIALGSHKQIIWHHSLDFPEGLNDVFKCHLHAVPNRDLIKDSAPSEGFRASHFAVNRQTVVEMRSQLMWTRNAALSAKSLKYQDALKFIEKLNQERYAGYNDWRIPTREDFEGLVHWGKKTGWGYELAHFITDYLSSCGFDNVQAGNYWTSTPDAAGRDRLFVLNTWNGIVRPLEHSNYYNIWPARTAQ